MTTQIPRLLWSAAIVSVAGLALSACTVIPGSSGPVPASEGQSSSTAPTPAPGSDAPASASENANTSQPTDGFTGVNSPGFTSTPASSLATLNADSKNGRRKVQVDVNSVEVRGKYTFVNFTATLIESGASDDAILPSEKNWQISTDFADEGYERPIDSEGNVINDEGLNSFTTNGVVLVDPKTGKNWTPAYDATGLCLCSRSLSDTFVGEGQSYGLYAVYAALPEDVTSVTIQFPNFGRAENVPVNRK